MAGHELAFENVQFRAANPSRQALYALLASVAEIQADQNAALKVEGIVVSQFQARASLPQRMVQELIDEGLPVLQPHLSASVKIKESHELARPMIHLEPRHKLTQEFLALYERLARQTAIGDAEPVSRRLTVGHSGL